jgi:hypothetical protein
MGKKTTSELRTVPLNLSLHKYSLSELRKEAEKIGDFSSFNHSFRLLKNYSRQKTFPLHLSTGFTFLMKYKVFFHRQLFELRTGIKSIHSKVSMILSPFKLIQEKYGKIGLPATKEQSQSIFQKFQNPNNAAYVGSLFSALLSESRCPNFPKVYGIFSGTAATHTIDISDDYEELSERAWFSQNIWKNI